MKPCDQCVGCLNLKIPVNSIWLRNGKFDVKRAILVNFDEQENHWNGYWEENFMTDTFKRIMFHFQAENPVKWISRVEKAIELREKQNVMMKN